jgi:hypothetical protein
MSRVGLELTTYGLRGAIRVSCGFAKFNIHRDLRKRINLDET